MQLRGEEVGEVLASDCVMLCFSFYTVCWFFLLFAFCFHMVLVDPDLAYLGCVSGSGAPTSGSDANVRRAGCRFICCLLFFLIVLCFCEDQARAHGRVTDPAPAAPPLSVVPDPQPIFSLVIFSKHTSTTLPNRTDPIRTAPNRS